MLGIKPAFCVALLSVFFTSLILISDVNAKTHRSNHHLNHLDHEDSELHSKHHGREGALPRHKRIHRLSTSSAAEKLVHKRSYPPSNSLSGSGGYPGSASYPASNPGSLSGYGSSSYIQPSSGVQLSSAPYPSANYGSNSGSPSYGYPIAKPGSLSGTGNSYNSGSSFGSASYPQSNFGTNSGSFGQGFGGSASFPSTNFGRNNSSSVHSYPTPRPGSLSGSGSSFGQMNITFGNNRTSFHPISRPSVTFTTNNGNVNQHTSGSSFQRTSVSSTSYQSPNWQSNSHSSGHHVSHHHHHYIYQPPKGIHSKSTGLDYPIFVGQPPPYVFEYRASDNKYHQLLAGLALYNLGRVSTTATSREYHDRYNPQIDEYCTFIVKQKSRSDEMQIDCRAISYFIYEDQPQRVLYTTQNFLNQTVESIQMMYPNGTLVTSPSMPQSSNTFNTIGMPDLNKLQSGFGQVPDIGTMMSNMHQTGMMSANNVMSVSDSRLRGHAVDVKTDMECYVTRHLRFSEIMKKPVPCELLYKYSIASLKSSAGMIKSSLLIFLSAFIFVLY